VTPAKALPLGQQWEAWLEGSAAATRKYNELTLKLIQRRHLTLADLLICAQCRPVCRAAAIPSIDVDGL
jgi:hypothetical protein